MDIEKALLVKSLKELLTITASPTFYRSRQGLHICYKYVWHNNLRCEDGRNISCNFSSLIIIAYDVIKLSYLEIFVGN